MRRYVEMKLGEGFLDYKPSEVAEALKMAGFAHAAISISNLHHLPDLERFKRELAGLGFDASIRLDLTPRTRRELLRALGMNRGRFEVLAVRCINGEVAVAAARDRRVDLISFRAGDFKYRFKPSIAGICNGALEVSVNDLTSSKASVHQKISKAMYDVASASTAGVPIVLSSGANRLSELKAARDLVAVARMLGLDGEAAVGSVSTVPLSIIKANRSRLEGVTVAEGVRLVGGKSRL